MGRVMEELAVNLELLVLDVTDKAIYAKNTGGDANYVWIPKSIISENHDFQVGVTYPCTMAEWFVDAKGLNDG